MLINPKITKFPANEFVTQERIDAMAPEKIEDGFYLACNFHIYLEQDQLVEDYSLTLQELLAKWDKLKSQGLPTFTYGCCDTPEQFISKYKEVLSNSPTKYCVEFTVLSKEHHPGWRWHKNGEYIGEKEPQAEYLGDEGPEITQVTIFHIYEFKD